MVITLGEASRQTGKSKAAITKAIRAGRLSAAKGETGDWQIDPAELFRVYPPASEPENRQTPAVDHSGAVELGVLRERCSHLENQISDLRRDRDDARSERDRLLKVIEEQAGSVRLLTDQTRKPAAEPERPARRGFRVFLHRLTGKPVSA
jgi:hypothetical protein